MNYEKIEMTTLKGSMKSGYLILETFDLDVREKWNGIERDDGIERGLVLVMNRKRERKCNVEVAVILIYQRERERERFVPCDFLEEECDDESLAQREREREWRRTKVISITTKLGWSNILLGEDEGD
jgi:hypothetical protein